MQGFSIYCLYWDSKLCDLFVTTSIKGLKTNLYISEFVQGSVNPREVVVNKSYTISKDNFLKKFF